MPRGHKHTPETIAKIGKASRRPLATEEHDFEWKTPNDYVDKTMSASDFAFVLEHLRFRNNLGTLELDRHARDYLLDALRRRHPPSST